MKTYFQLVPDIPPAGDTLAVVATAGNVGHFIWNTNLKTRQGPPESKEPCQNWGNLNVEHGELIASTLNWSIYISAKM